MTFLLLNQKYLQMQQKIMKKNGNQEEFSIPQSMGCSEKE